MGAPRRRSAGRGASADPEVRPVMRPALAMKGNSLIGLVLALGGTLGLLATFAAVVARHPDVRPPPETHAHSAALAPVTEPRERALVAADDLDLRTVREDMARTHRELREDWRYSPPDQARAGIAQGVRGSEHRKGTVANTARRHSGLTASRAADRLRFADSESPAARRARERWDNFL